MQQIKEFYANSGNIPIPDLDHSNIYKNLINVRCKEATSYRFSIQSIVFDSRSREPRRFSSHLPIRLRWRRPNWRAWRLPSVRTAWGWIFSTASNVGMDQYLLIQFLMGWTSIYQLFWCSPGVQGFDTLPCITYLFLVGNFSGMIHWLTINNHPSNPQQPIHSLRLAPIRWEWVRNLSLPIHSPTVLTCFDP